MVRLAILGCKLFIREIFKLVSQLCCFSNPFFYVKGSLSSEILYWRFLDGWSDLLPLALRTAGNGFAPLCPGYTCTVHEAPYKWAEVCLQVLLSLGVSWRHKPLEV